MMVHNKDTAVEQVLKKLQKLAMGDVMQRMDWILICWSDRQGSNSQLQVCYIVPVYEKIHPGSALTSVKKCKISQHFALLLQAPPGSSQEQTTMVSHAY